MRYVKMADIRTGDILARSVYGTDGRILIRANVMMTTWLIQRLKGLGYPGVYLFDPGETSTVLKSSLNERTRIRAAAHLKNLDLDKCTYIANEIVRQVLETTRITTEVNRISCHDLCTWTHSVDVCTYAVMCGVAMDFADRDLKDLCLAGLLHDIGKTLISLDILNKPGKLTSDEYALMKNHPEYGYELLRDTSISPCARAAVLEHHENEDGTGYPRGLAGDAIHPYAKIIHAVDVYEACTAIRPYKKPMNPADAVETLRAGYGTVFNTHVIDVLRSVIVLYPIGRRVLLSDGRTATVMENRRDALQRPVVKLSDGTQIDLCKTLNITILKILD